MKKIFSIFAALCVSAMMFAADVTIVLDSANVWSKHKGEGTQGDGSAVSITYEGITIESDKGYVPGWCLQSYAKSNFTISATSNIKQINFEFGEKSKGNIADGGLLSQYSVGATSWTQSLASQARFRKVIVLLGEGKGEDEKIEEVTVAQAKEIGMALVVDSGSVSTEKSYRVVGIVSKVKEEFNAEYKNQSLYMSDDGSDSKDNFQAYRCTVEAPGVAVGDKVAVTGKITKFVNNYTTIEISKGKIELIGKTALENVYETVKAKKMIENGQLILLRNGVKYNAVGAVVE